MTRTEAQDKVRSHLTRRGKQFVNVTEPLVRYWWRICNVALFGGKLYSPQQVIIKQFKDCYGYCKCISKDVVHIGISSDVGTRKLFLTALVHEMVHQWEHQTYGRMGHGKRFYAWQRRVHTYLGLDLNIDIDEADYYTHGEKQLYKRRHKGSQ